MFFIRNCNGAIVGNRKGYRTHKGAQSQCEKQGNLRSLIYSAYFQKPLTGNAQAASLVYSIRWEDQNA